MATITRPANDIIVTGNSSDIFEDIWDEDQAQGWGVFTRLVEGLYASTEIVVFGDDTTPTDVSDIDCCVKFDDDKYFYVMDNAEVTFGEKLDSETAVNGCFIIFNDLGNDLTEIEMKGTLNLYNTFLKQDLVGGDAWSAHALKLNGTGEFIDSQLRFVNSIHIYTVYTTYDVQYEGSINGLKINDDMTLTNIKTKGISGWVYNFWLTATEKTLYLINPKIGGGSFFYESSATYGLVTIYVRNYTPTLTWRGDTSLHEGSNYYQQFPFDIYVKDKDGNNLSGVTCLLEDTNDAEAFSTETTGDGTITQQWVNYKTYDSTNFATGGDTKTPHKLTLSKANYETLVIDEITVDELKDLEFELLPAYTPSQVTSTAEIMADLAGITFSANDHAVVSRVSIHEEDFEDFTNFPVVIVTPGDENCEEQANLTTESSFHPEIHFLIEGTNVATLEGWRDDIRNAIYRDKTLRSHILTVSIDEIILDEPEDRKLQHLTFMLTIVFDIKHT